MTLRIRHMFRVEDANDAATETRPNGEIASPWTRMCSLTLSSLLCVAVRTSGRELP